MNDQSTEDKLALQKRGEQTNAGAAKYSDSIGIGLAWAKGALPLGTYNDLAKQVYATLRSNDPNRYEQAARALSEMMDESARQQKAFQDANKGSKVFWGDPEKAAEYVRQLRAANAVYDPYTRLNNNVQYVMNTLKTYGYPEQVRDSFKLNVDKILNNPEGNNRIVAANQYIDQFLGDKQDLRRQNPVPGKPALDQQPQKAGNKNEPDPVQATAGDAQGVQDVQGTQGAQAGVQGVQAGAKTGNAVAGGGIQGSNNGSGGAQVVQAGAKPRMSDAEIDAFLKAELGGDNTDNGTYASADVPKGGTKTIGYDPYDPNPGNVSLAYAMRNAPEQERRAALINAWNQEHGISYTTGKDGVIYRTDPQHPNGYVDPFKNDLSTWVTATGRKPISLTRSSSTYASPGISSGGTYATGEGIKDANGNVLTNPGGDWEYQYALKNPQYGLGMRGKLSDAQKNYLQAVAKDMGFNCNFTGADRYI